MSHQATNWAMMQRGIKPTTKIVLWRLADRHNPDFGCFPSIDSLAYDCEMSERSVRRHIEELVGLGLVRVEKRRDARDNRFKANHYILCLDRVLKGAGNGQKEPVPAVKMTGGNRGISSGQNGQGPAVNPGQFQRSNCPHNLVRESVIRTGNSFSPPAPKENSADENRFKADLEPVDGGQAQTLDLVPGAQALDAAPDGAEGPDVAQAADVGASSAMTVGQSGAGDLINSEFEKVWQAYPRKVGKGAARQAWRRARRRASFDQIRESLWQFIEVTNQTPIEKIPHFRTWLDQERWEDDQSHARNRESFNGEGIDTPNVESVETHCGRKKPFLEALLERNLAKIDAEEAAQRAAAAKLEGASACS